MSNGTFTPHKQVLLADDCPDSRLLIQHILEGLEDIDVKTVKNGEEAVREVLQADQENHPYNLVLMDVIMPGLDGYEATKKLRENGIKSPIIALTVLGTSSDEYNTLNAGCNAHISKLCGKEALIAKVEEFLSADEQEPARVELPILPIIPSGMKGNQATAAAVLPMLKQLPDNLERIREACEIGDRQSLIQESRELSTFALYGYSLLARLLQDLQEQLGNPEQPIPRILVKEVERVLQGMHAGIGEIQITAAGLN